MNKVLNFERFNRVSNQREKVGYCASMMRRTELC